MYLRPSLRYLTALCLALATVAFVPQARAHDDHHSHPVTSNVALALAYKSEVLPTADHRSAANTGQCGAVTCCPGTCVSCCFVFVDKPGTCVSCCFVFVDKIGMTEPRLRALRLDVADGKPHEGRDSDRILRPPKN
jgi:hypothetical protein